MRVDFLFLSPVPKFSAPSSLRHFTRKSLAFCSSVHFASLTRGSYFSIISIYPSWESCQMLLLRSIRTFRTFLRQLTLQRYTTIILLYLVYYIYFEEAEDFSWPPQCNQECHRKVIRRNPEFVSFLQETRSIIRRLLQEHIKQIIILGCTTWQFFSEPYEMLNIFVRVLRA